MLQLRQKATLYRVQKVGFEFSTPMYFQKIAEKWRAEKKLKHSTLQIATLYHKYVSQFLTLHFLDLERTRLIYEFVAYAEFLLCLRGFNKTSTRNLMVYTRERGA